MKKLIEGLKDVWSRMTNGERVFYVLLCIGSYLFGFIFFRMFFTFLITWFGAA